MSGPVLLMRRTLPAFVAVAALNASSGGELAPLLEVDATLTVRLSAGKSTYATGELIPLELEFRGRADADYYFSTSSADRLRSMGRERSAVTPTVGVDDPLSEYFSSVGVVGSVVSGWHPLDGTPLVLRACLNDWVRFTRPGDLPGLGARAGSGTWLACSSREHFPREPGRRGFPRGTRSRNPPRMPSSAGSSRAGAGRRGSRPGRSR